MLIRQVGVVTGMRHFFTMACIDPEKPEPGRAFRNLFEVNNARLLFRRTLTH